VQPVTRESLTISVLEGYRREQRALSVDEVAERVRTPSSVARNVLEELIESGYLVKSKELRRKADQPLTVYRLNAEDKRPRLPYGYRWTPSHGVITPKWLRSGQQIVLRSCELYGKLHACISAPAQTSLDVAPPVVLIHEQLYVPIEEVGDLACFVQRLDSLDLW
jgi:hypothetical protein